MATGAKGHGCRHPLVVGAACAGAQSRGALLRPVRQGLRRQQRGAVPAPGEAPAQGRGLVLVQPAARAQDGRASRPGRRRDGRAADRSRAGRAAFRRLAGPHLRRDRRESRQQPSVLAGTAGIPAARRRELHRPARAHGAQHRAADRRASRPRHRGDGAWRHHPRRARPCLRHASRGGGALRDRQCLDHPDRAFRAGRSGACLARRLHQLHAARTRDRARRRARREDRRRARSRAGGLLERRRAARAGSPPSSASSAASAISARRRSRPPTRSRASR